LNNCIAHQDYTQNARVIVTEKVDKLILQNRGSFYDGNVEDYVLRERTPEKYRNPFLTQAMVNMDMIDTMGMGIRNMFIRQRQRYFPLPEFDLMDGHHVQVTIYGRLVDETYSKILIEKEDLRLVEVIALDSVQKGRTVSKEQAGLLKKQGLIDGRYPKVFLSNKSAVTNKERAQYIKNKPFDEEYYHNMILKFISKYHTASRQDINNLLLNKLSDVLSPRQKNKKISNILSKMKKEELIENIGSMKKSQWKLR